MTDLDLLLENAQLRDEIEPFIDESFYVVDLNRMTTLRENEYLASILAWERAPVLAIADWFDPPLQMTDHLDLEDAELNQQLHQIIGRLFEKNIILLSTGHLSDRQLYCLIARSILPANEKKLMLPKKYLRWQCLDPEADEESWLRFYATKEERNRWGYETGLRLPPMEPLPFPRQLPKHSE